MDYKKFDLANGLYDEITKIGHKSSNKSPFNLGQNMVSGSSNKPMSIFLDPLHLEIINKYRI